MVFDQATKGNVINDREVISFLLEVFSGVFNDSLILY